MSSRKLLSFSSSEEVLPYLARHRHKLTMAEMMNACAWAMDPVAVERSIIQTFLQSLPLLQPSELGPDPEDKNCAICLSAYGSPAPCYDLPVRLPCRHITGSACIRTWLESGKDSCPQCRGQAFPRPVAPEYVEPRIYVLLVDLRASARNFLTETYWEPDQSYDAFRRWARGVGQGDEEDSVAYRRSALKFINDFENFAKTV